MSKKLIWLVALTAIAISSIVGVSYYGKQKGDLRCRQRLELIDMYLRDHRKPIPPEGIKSLVKLPHEMSCPVCGQPYDFTRGAGPILDWNAHEARADRNQILVFCPQNCHGGNRNALLDDGKVVNLSETELVAAKANNMTYLEAK